MRTKPKKLHVVFHKKNPKKSEEDYRAGQKVIATLEIEDKGQDFIELDVLANGVLLGNSVMFSHGRLSLLGIGTLDGTTYHDGLEFMNAKREYLKGLSIYFYNTGEKKPLPWEADTLKYVITKAGLPVKPNRFIKK